MLKNPIHGLFQRGGGKVRFPAPFIFNGGTSLSRKQAAKKQPFQQPVEKRMLVSTEK